MPKPNFIFIAADDLCQIDMLQRLVTGFRMPNYERLAASGTEFRRAYCAVPICEPARTAVMTGISPFATRSFDLNISWKDIVRPEHLWTYRLREGDEPYHMVTQGKIFHGYVAVPQSVYDVLYDDTRFGFSYTPSGVETVQNGGSHGTGFIGNEHQWYDHQVATRAINFLNSYAGSKPFWCEVGFQKPHTPFEAPQRCFEAVPLENVILPTEWQGGWDTVPFARTYMTDEKADEDPNPANWTEAKLDYIRRTIRSYAAAALFMDDQLGRVLDALEASPHAGNTIVSFYSDHGYHLSDHNRWNKFTTYEQAAAAPMLIRVPGQTPRVVTRPVSHIDLGPTLLDYADIKVDAKYRGVSLRQMIDTGQQDRGPVPTFWFMSSSVIDHRLKRCTVYSNGDSELFDVATDYWARRNIRHTDPDFAALRDMAIETAYDWGLLLVEEAADVSRPSLLQAYANTAITTPELSTSFVALGDFGAKGWSPGYKVMYGNRDFANPEQRTIRQPPHIQGFNLMGRTIPISGHGTHIIETNDQGGTVNLAGMTAGETTLIMGDGDDVMTTSAGWTRLNVRAPRGNNVIKLGRSNYGTAWAGDGRNTITGGDNSDNIYAGFGDAIVDAGGGNDRIWTQGGNNTINAGEGDDIVTVDGGTNRITLGAGADTAVIKRTGLVQTITDLNTNDTLDLTDWAVLQPLRVQRIGAHTHVTAGMERVICEGRTVAQVTAQIVGATYVAA